MNAYFLPHHQGQKHGPTVSKLEAALQQKGIGQPLHTYSEISQLNNIVVQNTMSEVNTFIMIGTQSDFYALINAPGLAEDAVFGFIPLEKNDPLGRFLDVSDSKSAIQCLAQRKISELATLRFNTKRIIMQIDLTMSPDSKVDLVLDRQLELSGEFAALTVSNSLLEPHSTKAITLEAFRQPVGAQAERHNLLDLPRLPNQQQTTEKNLQLHVKTNHLRITADHSFRDAIFGGEHHQANVEPSSKPIRIITRKHSELMEA